MRNTRSDDYFAFMAEKKHAINAQQIGANAPGQDAFTDSDVVEFIEDPQIEVTESFISDTMIQRVFGRFREQLPVLVED